MKQQICFISLVSALMLGMCPFSQAQTLVPVADADWQRELAGLFERVDPFLGVKTDTEEPALLEASAFKDLPVDDSFLAFDLGNNSVNGAIGPRGTIQRALILMALSASPPSVQRGCGTSTISSTSAGQIVLRSGQVGSSSMSTSKA